MKNQELIDLAKSYSKLSKEEQFRKFGHTDKTIQISPETREEMIKLKHSRNFADFVRLK